MNKNTKSIQRNLSLFTFIAVYLIIAVILIFLESFQWETQWNVLTTFIPFFIMGAILDFIVSKNRELQSSYRIFAQLMPSGIFLLYGITTIYHIIGRPPVKAFDYIIWLFAAVPFFIASNFKEKYRRRILLSLIGMGITAAVYLHLTTITDELDEGNGLIVYLICIFLLFYAASELKKLQFTGIILGLFDAAVLIFLRNNPVSEMAKLHGWDFDIAFHFELLLLANFILCIFICLATVLIKERKPE